MAGPDKEEPVSMAGDSVSGDHDFPVKASPPREQSPSLGDMKQEQSGRKYSLLIGWYNKYSPLIGVQNN